MIALTVRQPYASRIIAGVKTIENRTRGTRLRGQILVHAGASIHQRFRMIDRDPLLQAREVGMLPRAALLGVVQLVDAHPAGVCPDPLGCLTGGGEQPTRDQPDVWHWVLADPVPFVTEVPRVKGQLGFWAPDDRGQDLAASALREMTDRA
jgi:hypothetical protein